MLDRYWHGDTSRISPEAPVPVVHVEEIEERPGGGANVALNIAALGGNVILLGYCGNDEAADSLEKILHGQRVSTAFTRSEQLPTVTKLRVLSRHQQLIRLDFERGFYEIDDKLLFSSFQKHLDEIDVVVLSDYGKGTLKNASRLIAMARKCGKVVVVDPKSRDFSNYRGATLITPNLSEFEDVVGHCADESEIVERGMELLEKYDIEALLITRSEHGMTLLRRKQDPLHLPTRAREVFDVTGAGDTVVSVLASAMAAGMEMPQATALANLAAGIVVGKVGTATATVSELRRALHEHLDTLKGVIAEEQLLVAIEDARAHGETIVMTNGCFDLLHAGHVEYLKQARALGDRLIVAVNSDDSVRRLKGETRPVNRLENRMAVLAALESVDWVVPFVEDTPERLICAVKPDYLVKGGDNDPANIPGNKCVWDNGGDVVVLNFVDGISTTKTISHIQSLPKESLNKS